MAVGSTSSTAAADAAVEEVEPTAISCELRRAPARERATNADAAMIFRLLLPVLFLPSLALEVDDGDTDLHVRLLNFTSLAEFKEQQRVVVVKVDYRECESCVEHDKAWRQLAEEAPSRHVPWRQHVLWRVDCLATPKLCSKKLNVPRGADGKSFEPGYMWLDDANEWWAFAHARSLCADCVVNYQEPTPGGPPTRCTECPLCRARVDRTWRIYD